MADKDIVRSIVTDAFVGGQCPAGEHIFAHFDFDNEDFLEQLILAGSTWEGLLDYFLTAPRTDARRIANVFYFLTPRAYVYFAPAYLIFVLNSEATDLGDSYFGFWELSTSSTSPDWHPWIREVLSLFSDYQLRVFGAIACLYCLWPNFFPSVDVKPLRFWSSVVTDGSNHLFLPDG